MAATLEAIALHVDIDSKKTTQAPPLVASRLAEMRASHALLPIPEAAGRHIEMPA
jgi:acyl-CoA thioester hydrolase